MLNNFWAMWIKEYLPSLIERKLLNNKQTKGSIERVPFFNEVVIIKVENQPRGSWKLGKVVELIKGEVDDVVRAAKVRTANGKILKRPLCYLFPLECAD